MVLNKNIKKRRRELDWTQVQTSGKCHIAQSYYSQIERGKLTPSMDILEGIARVLGLNAGEIWEVKQ